jgi:hypothetical protein
VVLRIQAYWKALDMALLLHPTLLHFLRAPTRDRMSGRLRRFTTQRMPRTPGNPYPLAIIASRALADLMVALPHALKSALAPVVSAAGVLSSSDIRPANFVRLLDGDTWVDDECVNAYGALLERHFAHHADKIAFVPSYYWSQTRNTLLDTYLGEKHGAFIRSCRYLFTPLNAHAHWALLVCDLKTGACHFVNSFSGTWRNFRTDAHHALFTALVQRLSGMFDAVDFSVKPTRLRAFPRQFDATSCAIYVLHAIECLAAANHATEFASATWDDKIVPLRLHMAASLVMGNFRPLCTVAWDAGAESDDVLGAPAPSESEDESQAGLVLRDAEDDDEEGDDDDYRPGDYGRCASCTRASGNLLACAPWRVAFCDRQCQFTYATRSNLFFMK